MGVAKALCASACDSRDDCVFADLAWTSNDALQACYLKGNDCGDWQSNTQRAYHIYQKGLINYLQSILKYKNTLFHIYNIFML